MKKIFAALLFPLCLWSQIDRNGDFQIWSWNFVGNQFSDEWFLLSLAEFRFGDDASKIYRYSFTTEAIYSPVKWLGLSPGYRQAWDRAPINSTHWKPEYTPLANIFFFLNPGKWELADRNRIEYRIKDDDPIHWVYRNRLTILPGLSFTSHNIKPFLENEIFIREKRGYNEDWLSVGISGSVGKYFSMELSYMARFQKLYPSGNWIHQNVLNIVLIFEFGVAKNRTVLQETHY